MSQPPDDYTVRADMLRLLDAFGSDDPDDLTATLEDVIQTGDVRKVLCYLLGTTYGLFVTTHGLQPTRDIIRRELAVAEGLEAL